MSSTAYTRPSKPPGPAGERRPPRLAKELGRIEPKKLGIGLVAGCCLALLTYISFARLFAIYSPVFGAPLNYFLFSSCETLFFFHTYCYKFFEILVREHVLGDEERTTCVDSAEPCAGSTTEQRRGRERCW
jgi:hypothetical protein